MKDRLFVHLPYSQATRRLPELLEAGLQPEIALRGQDLDQINSHELRNLAALIRQAGVSSTLHAPFHDLNPGALDPLVSSVTRLRFEQCFEVAENLGSRLIVFHPGYERWRYGHRWALWLEESLKFWPPLIERATASGIRIALENVFDHEPTPLCQLLDRLGGPFFGHCFDLGHWNLFDRQGIEHWFSALGRHMIHVHLHDNDGSADQHLGLGAGTIELSGLIQRLYEQPRAPSMTLEAHEESALNLSLAYLEKLGLI